MQVQYNDEQFFEILVKGHFRTEEFNSNFDNHARMIDFLNRLPIPEQNETPSRALLLIESLIKFYGTPILICFVAFYSKLLKDDHLTQIHAQALKNIASLVKWTLNGKKLEQLNFFFACGTAKKKYILPPKSKQEEDFLNYIQSLGTMLSELEKKIKLGKGKKSEQEFRRELNYLVNTFLEADMNRKLNFFQANYQNYFKSKVMTRINQIQTLFKDLDSQRIPQKPQTLTLLTQQRGKKSDSLQKKHQEKNATNTPLCCRTFFVKCQKIGQPESLHIQYKHYKFPYRPELINVLRKTICGFLNAEGGTIFIGIAEPVQTKRRVIEGHFYDQSMKEDVLKTFRRIAERIEPDIITHKLYSVAFVPIKNDKPPYSYISGKYVVRVTVRYGQRDDIYSYKSDDGVDMFSFRTENQVLHRQGRQVLNALRERIKNPLPIPQLFHQGPCVKPQSGKPVYDGDNSFDLSMDERQNPNQRYQLPKGRQYQPPEKSYRPQYNNHNINLVKSGLYNGQQSHRGNRFTNNETNNSTSKNPVKQQYREMVWSYLISGITQEQFRKFLKNNDFTVDDIKAEKKGAKDSYVQIQNQQKNKHFTQLLQKAKIISSAQVVKVTNRIQLQEGQAQYTYQVVSDSLQTKKIQFNNASKQGLLTFINKREACEAYLMVKQFGISCDFVH